MVTKRLTLYFPKSETEKPIVYRLIKDFDLVINIFRAKVTPEEYGYLVIDVSGTEDCYERGMAFVRSLNVQVMESGVGLSWDRARCTDCGNCIPHCPTNALSISDPRTRAVTFDASACVECLACIPNCPYAACKSLF